MPLFFFSFSFLLFALTELHVSGTNLTAAEAAVGQYKISFSLLFLFSSLSVSFFPGGTLKKLVQE